MLEFDLSHTGETRTLELRGDLTIDQVPRLKSALIEELTQSNPLLVKVGRIGKVDLPSLQLLYSAQRTFKSMGKKMVLADASSQIFSDAVNRAGFSWRSDSAFTEE